MLSTKPRRTELPTQSKLEGAKSKPADTLPEVLDDATMREYRQRLTDLQRQYAELSATLTAATLQSATGYRRRLTS